MASEKMKIGVLIILIVIIIILIIILMSHQKDGFCGTCQGMENKVCTNRKLLNQLYVDGKLTESSKLVRSKYWPFFNNDGEMS